MKKAIIVIAATVMFTACRDRDERTSAAAESDQQKPVVIEKVKYVPVQQAAPATTDNKKQGWSKAAKGTAIGVGGGALVGATVSKNKPAGAIIGGVIGGGTGYLIGRGEDKKDGRVKPKPKSKQ